MIDNYANSLKSVSIEFKKANIKGSFKCFLHVSGGDPAIIFKDFDSIPFSPRKWR